MDANGVLSAAFDADTGALRLDASAAADLIADQPMVVDGDDLNWVDNAGDLEPVLPHVILPMNANWIGVGNSTTQTIITNGATIPANIFGINAGFQVRFAGQMRNSSGGSATQTLRFRGNVGGVMTIYATQIVTLPDSATSRPFVWTISGQTGNFGVNNLNVTDHLVVHVDGANPRIEQMTTSIATHAYDPTVSRIWQGTVQHSVAHANMSINVTTALMEITRVYV